MRYRGRRLPERKAELGARNRSFYNGLAMFGSAELRDLHGQRVAGRAYAESATLTLFGSLKVTQTDVQTGG